MLSWLRFSNGFFFLCASCVLFAPQARALPITVLNNFTQSYLAEGGTGFSVTSMHTIPGTADTSSVRGESYSVANLDFSGDGDLASLYFAFNQKWSAGEMGAGVVNNMWFSANSDAVYDFSGVYQVTDFGNVAGKVVLSFYVQDQTMRALLSQQAQTDEERQASNENSIIARSSQISQSTLNETLRLGETGGDTSNFTKSLSGNLIAGHVYETYFAIYTQSSPSANGGTTAYGNVTFAFGRTAASGVPDDSYTIALVGLVFLGFACVRRFSLEK